MCMNIYNYTKMRIFYSNADEEEEEDTSKHNTTEAESTNVAEDMDNDHSDLDYIDDDEDELGTSVSRKTAK